MLITKRNGTTQEFDINKIIHAIEKAFKECHYMYSDATMEAIAQDVQIWEGITVEEIQDEVEETLNDWDYFDVALAYHDYRGKRALMRESDTRKIFNSIIKAENNEVTRENANMNADTPAGMMMKFASETTKPFTDKYILSDDVRKAVEDNIIHIHDKDYYLTKSFTCLQHPLDRILENGFTAGHGSSRAAKRIETAAIIACISLETCQNEMHGGQAIPAFDFYMAPYVRKTFEEEYTRIAKFVDLKFDEIPQVMDDYIPSLYDEDTLAERVFKQAVSNTVRRVHQAMESFIHNMNTIHSRGGRL